MQKYILNKISINILTILTLVPIILSGHVYAQDIEQYNTDSIPIAIINTTNSSVSDTSANTIPETASTQNSDINNINTTIFTTENKIDLELKQSLVSDKNPKINDTVNIWLDISNTASSDAYNVKVLYSFSPNLELLASQGNGTFMPSKADYYWVVGDVLAGVTQRINLFFKVKDQAETLLTAEVFAVDELDIDSTAHNNNPSEDDYSQLAINISSTNGLDGGSVLGASDQNTGNTTQAGNITNNKTLPNTGFSKPLLYRLVTIIMLFLVVIKYYVGSSYFSTSNKSRINKFRPGY